MDWKVVLEKVWELANSPAGIAVIASVALYLLNKVYTKKPAWQKYQGLIIAGVKHAEKMIDDNTENSGMRKFDEALKWVVKIVEKTEGKKASASLVNSVKEGISIVHDKVSK